MMKWPSELRYAQLEQAYRASWFPNLWTKENETKENAEKKRRLVRLGYSSSKTLDGNILDDLYQLGGETLDEKYKIALEYLCYESTNQISRPVYETSFSLSEKGIIDKLKQLNAYGLERYFRSNLRAYLSATSLLDLSIAKRKLEEGAVSEAAAIRTTGQIFLRAYAKVLDLYSGKELHKNYHYAMNEDRISLQGGEVIPSGSVIDLRRSAEEEDDFDKKFQIQVKLEYEGKTEFWIPGEHGSFEKGPFGGGLFDPVGICEGLRKYLQQRRKIDVDPAMTPESNIIKKLELDEFDGDMMREELEQRAKAFSPPKRHLGVSATSKNPQTELHELRMKDKSAAVTLAYHLYYVLDKKAMGALGNWLKYCKYLEEYENKQSWGKSEIARLG